MDTSTSRGTNKIETNKVFREQIEEDIKLIQKEISWDKNINKPEYAFNYWILSNLYHLDINTCQDSITEYNDKGIDCFVHFEEDKELYIIQNKYYSVDTKLSSKEISDFISRPLASLEDGNYKNEELQSIYNKIKNDNSYKIFLHFYATKNNKSEDIKNIIKNTNVNDFIFDFFDLNAIKEKYYGKSFKEDQVFNFTFSIKNKGTFLAIRPLEYELYNLKPTFYIMAKVSEVYNLLKYANDKQYPLFEQNIREYLGTTSGINKGIITTLRDKNERNNFFYYNNGITIIAKKAEADSKSIKVENPQIVNGCQTVNSIFEVLKKDNPKNYDDVFVMVKILVIEDTKNNFYRDVVKYNNSQNAINEKVFAATLDPFFRIQEGLKKYGILLNVKQSDKNQNKSIDKKTFNELINKANDNSNFFEFKTVNDIQINLETLLQIIGAFEKDAHFAYTKKSLLLKIASKEYNDFSTEIANSFTIESMFKLVNIYKKAYKDQQASEDKKTPAPYYLLNMIGYFLSKHNINKQSFLKKIEYSDLNTIYEAFKPLPSKYYNDFYKKHNNAEYNQMLKKEVDTDIFDSIIDNLKDYNPEKYNQIIDKIENKIE